jgi:hypothetical protein
VNRWRLIQRALAYSELLKHAVRDGLDGGMAQAIANPAAKSVVAVISGRLELLVDLHAVGRADQKRYWNSKPYSAGGLSTFSTM